MAKKSKNRMDSVNREVTEWMIGTPPCNGWWETLFVDTDGVSTVDNHPEVRNPERRWWNGRMWSVAVHVGMSNKDMNICKSTPIFSNTQDGLFKIYWRGLLRNPKIDTSISTELKEQYLDGYYSESSGNSADPIFDTYTFEEDASGEFTSDTNCFQ